MPMVPITMMVSGFYKAFNCAPAPGLSMPVQGRMQNRYCRNFLHIPWKSPANDVRKSIVQHTVRNCLYYLDTISNEFYLPQALKKIVAERSG
jgi:hypothetical protein